MLPGCTQVAFRRAVSRSIASRLRAEGLPARIVHQAQLAARFGQPQVGIVLAQLQPVFGAAGEHAVGLGHAAGDQVVDQHAEVGLVAPRAPAGLAARQERGVDAGQQPLRRGLFVAGGAVDLPGEEQAGDRLGLQRGLEPARVEVVVLDGIAGPQDVRVLQARDRAHQRQLDVERQAGRDAVRVELVGRQAFGLEEDLVARLVGEAVDLVLDGRAVARARRPRSRR